MRLYFGGRGGGAGGGGGRGWAGGLGVGGSGGSTVPDLLGIAVALCLSVFFMGPDIEHLREDPAQGLVMIILINYFILFVNLINRN